MGPASRGVEKASGHESHKSKGLQVKRTRSQQGVERRARQGRPYVDPPLEALRAPHLGERAARLLNAWPRGHLAQLLKKKASPGPGGRRPVAARPREAQVRVALFMKQN